MSLVVEKIMKHSINHVDLRGDGGFERIMCVREKEESAG